MGTDIWYVVRFWAVLFLVGSAAFPLTRRLFPTWFDRGYLFSKSVGLVVVTWIVYAMGTVRLMPFSFGSIMIGLMVVFTVGLFINFQFSIFNFQSIFKFQTSNFKLRKRINVSWPLIIIEEAFFLIALVFWSWVKGHEPAIRGLEKFMDFGFTQSILAHPYFPTPDMWYGGHTINYYYFGHIALAILTKLSGIDLAITFNLILAALFAFTLTMSFSIGKQFVHGSSFVVHRLKLSTMNYQLLTIFGGLLTAFLVTLAGNMQTLYAFTKGYTGDAVKPFWQLLWSMSEFWEKLPQGLNTYWYANATRFIPFTIHEFPSYSFVVSDIHGHVLSLPFVLLAIALLVSMFGLVYEVRDSLAKRVGRTNTTFLQESLTVLRIIFYGFLMGILLMTNALDGPIYLGLFVVLLFVSNWSNLTHWTNWKQTGKILLVLGISAVVSSLPFITHFSSFVHGIAINCPPAFLANSTLGFFIFEGVEKCQKSPLWMMAILWGFFLYCGGWLIVQFKIQNSKFKIEDQHSKVEKLLIVFFFFSIVLIIFPEFFYFKDIYPAHFRSNTMFKLGYQAFILFSIVSGYTIVQLLFHRRQDSEGKVHGSRFIVHRKLFLILLLPQLFFVSIYPIFSVRSYFDSLRTYKGLYGLTWLQNEYADDFRALEWLKSQGCQLSVVSCQLDRPTIVEADGDSYTDYNHFSAFSGYQTIVGWAVHEWLWRGSYDVVAPRREEVRKVYESTNIEETKQLLEKYSVTYVIVGMLEREKFKGLQEDTLRQLGKEVFRSGSTVIYRVSRG